MCAGKSAGSLFCAEVRRFFFLSGQQRENEREEKNWNNPPVQRNTMEAVLRDPAEKSGRNGAETEKIEKDVRSRKGAGPGNSEILQII